MTRARRLDPLDGWHHVMSRGVDRQRIFLSDDDRLDFCRLLGRINRKFEVEIHSYCLMDNHFHLLLRCPESGLSAAVHDLLSIFARRVNDRSGRVGHLFGDRFTSRLITSHRYLATVVRYIHRNPLDIATVTAPADYHWSSHRSYLELRPRPAWLTTGLVLGWFDDTAAFDRFVHHATAGEACRAPRPEIDPQSLLDALDLLLAERSDATRRHAPAQRRAVALALTPHLGADAAGRLLDHLGLQKGTTGFRVAQHRGRRLADAEPPIREVVELMLEMFEIAVTGDAAA